MGFPGAAFSCHPIHRLRGTLGNPPYRAIEGISKHESTVLQIAQFLVVVQQDMRHNLAVVRRQFIVRRIGMTAVSQVVV